MWQALLTNPYTIAVIVPTILILCGSFAKKIVRGSGWELKDTFLGVELTLSALTSALLYLLELAKEYSSGGNQIPVNNLVVAAVFLAFNLFSLLLMLSIHQDMEKPGVSKL